MLLRQAIKEFKFHCEFEKNLSQKTLRAYEIDLEQFLSYENFQTFNMIDIDKNKIKSYIQSLYRLELKAKTIKRKVAVVKALFNYLEFEESIEVNPFRKLHISIKEPQTLPKTIELNKITKLLKYLYQLKDNYTNKDIYSYKALVRDIVVLEILFSTGIRVSELCNIKCDTININNGLITIHGKGDKERVIQICDSETKTLLKEYVKLFHNTLSDNSFFLVNRLGNQLSEQSVRLMIKKYQKILGIEQNITPHMFRHSFATLLLEEGVDIRYIQNMLGHSSISTTQIYTQVNLKHQKKILATKHPRRNLKFITS